VNLDGYVSLLVDLPDAGEIPVVIRIDIVGGLDTSGLFAADVPELLENPVLNDPVNGTAD